MPAIEHRVPHRLGRGHTSFIEYGNGGFKDSHGQQWSPPLRKITDRMRQQPEFQVFGDAILSTADRVEWRTMKVHGRVYAVYGFYPGITPVERDMAHELGLCVEVRAFSKREGRVKWFDDEGTHTFESDYCNPEAAVRMLERAVQRMLEKGSSLNDIICRLA